MDDIVRRLKPDPENWPVGVRAELQALADAAALLPPAERGAAMRARLSPRTRAFLEEQGRRALLAYRLLTAAEPAR
jgi:hypothetical protein